MLTSDPRPSRQVTSANWQDPDLIRWSFSHVDEVLPTETIPRGESSVADLPLALVDVRHLVVSGPSGASMPVAEVVRATDTDGWLVLHNGRIVAEEYLGGMTPATRHLLQSVSKSVVSTVVGALVGRRIIDPRKTVGEYVPALADSGYANATVGQVLDMRSGIGFSEDYLDPRSDSRTLEATVGWAPLPGAAEHRTLRSFVRALRQVRPHGGAFEYRSCETDVLGLVCEGATGLRFPQVASELVWSRIGAEYDAYICVDAEGTGVFDGGICATLRDLARFGATIISAGTSLAGEQVMTPEWTADLFTDGADSVEAFANGSVDHPMPGGMYRSQFWFPSANRDVALALGIHGQMIYLDRRLGMVGIKLSSWAAPQDLWKSAATVAMFAAIGDLLD